MPRISLLAPSLNLEEGASGHQRGDVHGDLLNTPSITPGAGADAHESSGLPQPPSQCWRREQEPQGWSQGGSQRAGSQIGVLVLELAVQCQPPFLPVVGEEGGQGVDFAER